MAPKLCSVMRAYRPQSEDMKQHGNCPDLAAPGIFKLGNYTQWVNYLLVELQYSIHRIARLPANLRVQLIFFVTAERLIQVWKLTAYLHHRSILVGMLQHPQHVGSATG